MLIPALAQQAIAAEADCRYIQWNNKAMTRPAEYGFVMFPHTDLFRPLLAHALEPKFSGSYSYTRPKGPSDTANGKEFVHEGSIAAGTNIGLMARRRASDCNGFQINIHGGIFAQFDLGSPSRALLNTDFVASIPFTYRHERFSARFRFGHQSSHLGDEFLKENNSVKNAFVSLENMDLLISYEFLTGKQEIRVYGGTGVIWHSKFDTKPGYFQMGGEWRGPTLRLKRHPKAEFTPIGAADLISHQTRNWGLSGCTLVGLEHHRSDSPNRFVGGLAYHGGYSMWGQFFAYEKRHGWGIDLQYLF